MEKSIEKVEDDTPLNKILVIRFSSIGDIVLTTPIVRCLKQQLPNCQVHFLTKYQYAPIIENNPYVNKVHLFDKNLGLRPTIKELKQENFGFVVDLHKNLRSLQICFALGKPFKAFNKINIKKWLYVHFKKNLLPKVHIVDRYFDTIKSLNVHNDNKGLDFFLREEDYIAPDVLPLSFQEGYIAIAVGAKHQTKQIPTDIIIAICEKIGGNILLFGDINDKGKANKIENAIGSRVFNGCGAYSLPQTASLIDNSLGLITADTGLMHIGAALKKNIISVWGNTVPEFGMSVYLPKDCQSQSYIFEVKDLSCRPCSKLGYKKCPRRHFKCMKQQDTFRISQIANEWLNSHLEK